MMKEIAFERLTHDVRTVRENTANFLANVQTDLRLLQNTPALQAYAIPHHETDRRLKTELTRNTLAFASTKQIYFQIRFISRTGNDIVHVEAVSATDSQEVYRVVPPSEDSYKGTSYYFLLAREASVNGIAFAPAELVDTTGERIPVICFVAPLVSHGQSIGLLVANVFAKDLFGVIEHQHHFEAEGRVALVSSDGHYLYDSEKKKDWNRLLASRENDNLQHDFPSNVVANLLSGREGVATNDPDRVIAYGPLFSTTDHPVLSGPRQFFDSFFVLESIPRNVMLAPARSFARIFAAAMLLFFVMAIVLGLIATRQFTTPIAMLEAGADIIARGNYFHRLNVKTHDEIERLAGQFNVMAASLESHEREIRQHRVNLEDKVATRTKELFEEKTKLQAIIDNVPSAFIVLEKDCTVKTASSAFERVTGLSAERVQGVDCRTVLGELCHTCVCREAAASGQIETHVNHIHKAGTERFIEHMAIPMKEDGRVASMLEIVTDITKRKRLEQRLMQTERLSAAGELSALIAHEFRNALTSVKMILQLHQESKRRTQGERKSLAVALDSILQMERIVTELLSFAKPLPLKWSMENLSEIASESLRFVVPRLEQQRIVLRRSFDATLPPVEVDAARMKEAVINVLVNAIQAVENIPGNKGQGTVTISVHGIRLQKPLEGLAPGDLDGSSSISLPTGTACAVIEISDSGSGIPAEIINRIFDPFFTTKTDGTGLGLPMVNQTITAHGGVMTVESKEHEGSTFRMYLPISPRRKNNGKS